MTKIKKDYLSLATVIVQKMRSTTPDLSKLPRLLSPFFKTSLLSNKVLHLKLKNTKNSVTITFVEIHKDVTIFRIYSKKHSSLDIQISATSNKELLTKIIQKYEFFN